jgi:ABC-2 type transport system permease protein
MPKLNWDTEQKAVKQNFNGLISLFGSFAIGALVVFLSIRFPVNFILFLLVISAVFALIDWILYKILISYGVKRLEEIDG